MSAVGLFAIGVVVTVIVGAALGLLVYGAILESRDAAERKVRGDASSSTTRNRRPSARSLNVNRKGTKR